MSPAASFLTDNPKGYNPFAPHVVDTTSFPDTNAPEYHKSIYCEEHFFPGHICHY